jgi:hypothetical protein
MMTVPDLMHPNTPSLESQAPLNAVRWLAERCGVAGTATPLPRMASEMLRDPEWTAIAQAYIVWWMRNPDKGSTFEVMTSALRDLPDQEIVPSLQRLGYDGLLYPASGDIVGHVFFQARDGEVSAFSAAVSKSFRGGRRWATFSLDYVAYAASLPGVRRASVGTGRNLVARLLVRLIRAHTTELGWRANDDGWMEFDTAEKA